MCHGSGGGGCGNWRSCSSFRRWNGNRYSRCEGLRRIEEALREQKGQMRRAWDDAMVSVENELVFTELETLMVVAKDAIDGVIGTSVPFIKEAQAQIPDAHG